MDGLVQGRRDGEGNDVSLPDETYAEHAADLQSKRWCVEDALDSPSEYENSERKRFRSG